MDFFRRFTVLICAPAFDADDLEGHRLNEITVSIEKLGFQVIRARRIEDAEIAVQTDSAIGCMVVDWGKKGLEGKDGGADQPDAQARPGAADRHPGPPQAAGGHPGRGAGLYRRLYLPGRGRRRNSSPATW